MSDDNVIRLVDRAAGYAVERGQMFAWLSDQLAWIESKAHAKSVVIVVETEDGKLYRLAQSTGPMDLTRTVGLLQTAIHWALDGDNPVPPD